MCLNVCLHVRAPHMCLVPEESKKRVSDHLKWELHMVINHHLGARLNWGSLQEHQVLLTAEPPLQLFFFFIVGRDRVGY